MAMIPRLEETRLPALFWSGHPWERGKSRMTRASQSSGEPFYYDSHADIRPYTAISPPNEKGTLRLLIKEYKVGLLGRVRLISGR